VGEKLLLSFNVTVVTGHYTIAVRHRSRPIQRSPFEVSLQHKFAESKSGDDQDDVAWPPDHKEIQFLVAGRMPDNSPGAFIVVYDKDGFLSVFGSNRC
jgi:hypothetical protein